MTITLATLKDATAQQVFDQVATHLLTQAKASLSKDGVCEYRNWEGLKCGAGCLISDDEYNEGFEGASWIILVEGSKYISDAHAGLIQKLQHTHDSARRGDGSIIQNGIKLKNHWLRRLEEVAEEENLSPAVLEKFKIPE